MMKPATRFSLVVLFVGSACWANDEKKEPWIEPMKGVHAKFTGQRGTFAAVSLDGGRTWPHIRPVPGVRGYLSVAQAPNGVIYLFGSRMSCAAFNEAWLRSSVRSGP